MFASLPSMQPYESNIQGTKRLRTHINSLFLIAKWLTQVLEIKNGCLARILE